MALFSPEQLATISWLALPKRLRTPKTQVGLAKTLEVHHVTISKWKAQDEFKSAVERARRDRIEDHASDLYDVAIKQALAGNDKYFKMLMDVMKDTWGKRELTVNSVSTGSEKNLSTEQMAEQMWAIIERTNPAAVKGEFMANLASSKAPAAQA